MLKRIDHRPWPPPAGPWVMAQSWLDLLFAHWPIPLDELRRVVPASLTIDTFDGQGWVGVVPFRMTGVRPRGVPALPWLSAFPELNVRTYVTLGGKAGVFFFSLDAANPVAVATARRWYHLPYFNARMSLRREGVPGQNAPPTRSGQEPGQDATATRAGEEPGQDAPPTQTGAGRELVHYISRRTHRGAPQAEFIGQYRPTGDVFRSAPGSLEAWLTERYCLYAVHSTGRVYRGEIHHHPWPLQEAEAEIEVNTMTLAHGIGLPEMAPLLHFARRLDVVVWPLRPAGRDG